MLNGVDIKIRMTRGKDEFCLMHDDGIAYKLNIVSTSLFVKTVLVSPGVRLGHAEALLSTTAKYPKEHMCLIKKKNSWNEQKILLFKGLTIKTPLHLNILIWNFWL